MNKHISTPSTVLITGASRGIGHAAALAFAQEGFNIAINCHKNEALLTQTADEIRSLGCKCIALTGDISQGSVADTLFEMIQKEFGRLDILVNNAGISYIGLLTDMTDAQWHQMFKVNMDSIYNCCKRAIPLMLSRHSGKIINVSSVWGNAGASCEVAYSATKGAVNTFTKALAKELAPSNIQVNAVAFGTIDTEMNAFLTPEERQLLTEEIPSCRFGTPEEAGDMLLKASQLPAYFTGQVMTMDGGWI